MVFLTNNKTQNIKNSKSLHNLCLKISMPKKTQLKYNKVKKKQIRAKKRDFG